MVRATLTLALATAVFAPAASAALAPGCAPTLASAIAVPSATRQLITVVAPRASSTLGTVELWRLQGRCWRRAAGPWQAWLGSRGVSFHHREGDDTTPAGAFGIGSVIYGTRPDPGVAYRYHELVCGDWWDEQPGTSDYNRFVHVPCGTRPQFAGASEPLWLSPLAYAYFAVIDYNSDPVVQGAGSGIFLHVSFGAPTDGCVSLGEPELVAALRWLRPQLSPLIVIGTAATIGEL